MTFKFLEEFATADIAFIAEGKTLKELFQSAGDALIESLANPKTVKKELTREFTVKENTPEDLLFSFLEEIIYLKDKDGMVFNSLEVEVDEKNLQARAKLKGAHIDPETQELRNDVKAVTMHYYKIEKEDEGWKTRVVLDV
ncbi:archease [Candidatus Woesearchaeota archaeon]|nr:MAG: archease [Candidatus Woesearchaeota archaeon]